MACKRHGMPYWFIHYPLHDLRTEVRPKECGHTIYHVIAYDSLVDHPDIRQRGSLLRTYIALGESFANAVST